MAGHSQRDFVDKVREVYGLARIPIRNVAEERQYVLGLAGLFLIDRDQPDLVDGQHTRHNLGKFQHGWIHSFLRDGEPKREEG